ncbi:MAG: TRAP transporter substrate-binding protein DctP [Deltaproteobacteria bacterium]|nr:TRAP transporter substrate-binding protein DctP [Deltaproteobacteria bacterium]
MKSNVFIKTWFFKSVMIFMALFLGLLIYLPHAGAADKPIKLRYGSAYTESMWIGQAAVLWMKKVEKESGGKVKFDSYFGGTLITNKNAAGEVRGGTVDIAHIAMIFDPEFQLLQRIRAFIWGLGINDVKLENQIYNDLIQMYPLEKPIGDLKVMARTRNLPYQLITAKKPVRTLDDFKGLRLKCSPQYVSLLKSLGAEGINLPTSELYVSLQKGTVDGTLFDYAAIKSFKLQEVAKYATNINLGSGVLPMEIMSRKSFDGLPKDIQQIIDGSLGYWESEMYRLHLIDEEAGTQLGKDNGMTFFDLGSADMKQFHKLSYEAAREEARVLDNMGLPGSKVLEDMRRLNEKYSK